MRRNFNNWFSTFKKSISDYQYYTDFDTVYKNAETYKIELNMLNSLIWDKNIESKFIKLLEEYPSVLKCIPILLAVRESEIFILDDWKELNYNFKKTNYSTKQYSIFMRKTWLFDLLENHIINNCYDYVLWVETWLNSNARKNRWWHLMENLVENFIIKAWFKKDKNYYKEMNTTDIEKISWINLSSITNWQSTEKRFDFVIKTKKCTYWIETNFYASSWSKLNETARSYKMLAEESKNISWFKFIRFTDWEWRKDAKNNLKETFDVLPTIYNINDMNNWIIKTLFL